LDILWGLLDVHMHIYVVTKLLMFYFWIKLTIKIPNYLTQRINICVVA